MAIEIRNGHGNKHRWKVLGVGVAANASFSAAFQGIPTTAVFMRADYHLTTGTLGLVLGLLGLGIAISELPWGYLTDRWGDRRVLLMGLAATSIALAVLALLVSPNGNYVPGAIQIAIGLVVVGLMGGSVNGSSGRAVMSWFRDSERGFAMSIRQTAVPLGGGLGAILLPALAEKFGFAAVFGVLATLCFITACFTWMWLHEPEAESSAASAESSKASAPVSRAPSPLFDKSIWRLVLGIGLLCAPQFAVLTFATVFLHDYAKASVGVISITMLVIQIGAMTSRIWSGRWTDRKKNRREYLRTCASLSMLAFFALAALIAWDQRTGGSPNIAFIVVLLVAAGVLVSAWHGVAYTELATMAGITRAGTALGMGNTCVFVMLFLTPAVIPVIVTQANWSAVWVVGGLCALLTYPLFPAPVRRSIAEGVKAV